MYTVYIIFTIILIVSFITGNIVLLYEHKSHKKKITIKNNIIIDKEVL